MTINMGHFEELRRTILSAGREQLVEIKNPQDRDVSRPVTILGFN